MRCLVFALAMIFAGCSTHNQLGSGDSRGSSALPGPETTVIWLDNREGFPSVGYFDVQTIFNETDLGPGSYVRIAALQVTGTSPEGPPRSVAVESIADGGEQVAHRQSGGKERGSLSVFRT